MSGIRIGDRVRVHGTETPYEGRTGEVRNCLDPCHDTRPILRVGVSLDGLDGLRWFSEGELMPIKTTKTEV